MQADLTSNNTEGTKSTNHSNNSSIKGTFASEEESIDKPKKAKKKTKDNEDMKFQQQINSQLDLDEQALIDQMNASNMVALAMIEKEKENQQIQDQLHES